MWEYIQTQSHNQSFKPKQKDSNYTDLLLFFGSNTDLLLYHNDKAYTHDSLVHD